MTAGQPLRGLSGQGMNGRRPNFVGAIAQFPAGSYTYVIPSSGHWKWAAWGPGGSNGASAAGAASGGYSEAERVMLKGQRVTITVPPNTAGGTTSLTLPDGTIIQCGQGGQNGGAAGTATGGDLNLPGSTAGVPGLGSGGGASTGTAPGGGAPGNLPFRGGAAGALNVSGETPGGGAGSTGSGTTFILGGSALVLGFFERL